MAHVQKKPRPFLARILDILLAGLITMVTLFGIRAGEIAGERYSDAGFIATSALFALSAVIVWWWAFRKGFEYTRLLCTLLGLVLLIVGIDFLNRAYQFVPTT